MIAFFTDSWAALLAAVVAAYLLGSVNWALEITRLFSHKDIRTVGSGNAGATNVLRSQGVLPAILTVVGDLGKSLLATWFGGWLLVNWHMGEAAFDLYTLCTVGRFIAGIGCIIGHARPLFYGFRGGKGVLTTLGMFLVADWRVALMCLSLFIFIVAISRMVSLGSVVSIGYGTLIIFVLRTWVDKDTVPMIVFTTAMTFVVGLIIAVKHKDNLKRVAAGTERRLGEK